MDGSLTESPPGEAAGAVEESRRCRRAPASGTELPGRVGRAPTRDSCALLGSQCCNATIRIFLVRVRSLTLPAQMSAGASPSPNPPAWTSTLQQKELEHVRDFQGRHRCRHACRVHLDRGEQCRVGAVPEDVQAAARHQRARRIQARRRLLPGRRRRLRADAGGRRGAGRRGGSGGDAGPLPRLGQGRPARPLRHRRGQGAGLLLRVRPRRRCRSRPCSRRPTRRPRANAPIARARISEDDGHFRRGGQRVGPSGPARFSLRPATPPRGAGRRAREPRRWARGR